MKGALEWGVFRDHGCMERLVAFRIQYFLHRMYDKMIWHLYCTQLMPLNSTQGYFWNAMRKEIHLSEPKHVTVEMYCKTPVAHCHITLLFIRHHSLNEHVQSVTYCFGEETRIFQQHYLTHWGRDKMVAVSQTTLLITFSWMKMLDFLLRFHWSLFLRVQLTIIQHWFR